MSHVTAMANKDVPIKDLERLSLAVTMLNQQLDKHLEIVERADYRTWKADHNERLVGDYPIPKGWTKEELGHNAVRVIRLAGLPDNARGNYYGSKTAGAPYEIGVVPNKNGDGYTLMYDFFNQGYGIMGQVGEKCELLYQMYQAAGVEMEAKQLGHVCNWELNEETGEMNAEILVLEEQEMVG